MHIAYFHFQHASKDVEKMVLGNKCDMNDRRQVSKDRGEQVSGDKFISYRKIVLKKRKLLNFDVICISLLKN